LGDAGFGPARDRHRHDDVINTFASVSKKGIERTADGDKDYVIYGAFALVADGANLGKIGSGDAEAALNSHRTIQ
jgi:hypothetical protein